MRLDFHQNHRLLFGVALASFVCLTVVIAITPARWLQENNPPLSGSPEPGSREKRGLAIYVSEGCLYCHTQQVRPLALDKPFGRPSAPGDYSRLRPLDLWRMTPELLGTERTGPDLSNVAARQPSATWNYIHLYNPRAVVKGSVMQAYPWLFAVKENPGPGETVIPLPPRYAPRKGKVVATEAAKDLVAYLAFLRQTPLPGGGATAEPAGAAPAASEGAAVYATHCAGCHGQDGEGTPGLFPPMKGDPVVTAADPARHIGIVLFGLKHAPINGTTYGAEMPAHKDDLTDGEIAAVVNHERTSWGNHAPTVTAGDVARIRKGGP